MTSPTPGVAAEVERYLRTGESDPYYAAWSGANFIESARLAHGDLENALIAEVRRRSGSWRPPEARPDLDVVAFHKRETFAYACEAYAQILERAKVLSERTGLAGELDDDFGTGDERVERGEVAEIVRQAAARRNGWKVILGMCASTPGGRRVAASPPDPATAS